MENFIKEFDQEYKNIIGNYNIEMARDTIPVSFHGSQVMEEFALAWYHIMQHIQSMNSDTITFLEVGAYKGLWPLMLSKVCKLYNKTPKYTTVTLIGQDSENHSLSNVEKYYKDNKWEFNLIDADSILESTRDKVLEYNTKFDLVFIDADHRYEYAKKDIELYSPLCKEIQIFHDVKPRIATEHVGVWQAICDCNIKLDMEFSTNDLNYGIGLKFKNK
jgi:hypothetical protein